MELLYIVKDSPWVGVMITFAFQQLFAVITLTPAHGATNNLGAEDVVIDGSETNEMEDR